MHYLLYIITLLVSGILPASLQAAPSDPIQEGRLDLSAWNPEDRAMMSLKGKWEFYWSQLLGPNEFRNEVAKNKSMIQVPGSWNRVAEYPSQGYATYRLHIHLPQVRELAVSIPAIWSASLVYIDNQLVHKAGRVGPADDEAVYKAGAKDRYLVFTPSQTDFDIIIQVSSFEFFLAGITFPMTLGTPEAVLRDREIDTFLGTFLVGSLFIMGIYHLCLYALRTKARSTLYFGLLMFCAGGYMLGGRGTGLLLFIPDLGFATSLRLFNTWVPGVAVFAFFTYELFPQQYSKRFPYWIAGVCWPLYALILVSEPRLFVGLTVLAQISALVVSVYTFYVLRKAIQAKVDGAWIFIGGSCIVIFTSMHDVLQASGYIQSISLGSTGFFLFIFFQSLLLARRFSNAFIHVELSEQEIRQLSEDLRKERDQVLNLNANLETKVQEKTRDIRSIMTHIPLGIFAITTDQYRIHKDYSEHLHGLLEVSNLADVNACPLLFDGSQLTSDEKSQAISVLDACLGEDIMMFEMNAHSLPLELRRKRRDGEERIFELTWNPIASSHGVIEKILVTLRDVTDFRALEEDALDKKEELQFIGELISVPGEAFRRFIHSCRDFIIENRKLINSSNIAHKDMEVLKVLFINMHTMKGTARSMYFKKMTRIFHDVEQYYSNLQKDPLAKWDLARMNRDINEVEAIVNTYISINQHKLGRKTDDEKDIEFPESQVLNLYHNLLTVSMRIKHVLDEKTHGILKDLRGWIFPKIFSSAQETLADVCLCVATLAKDLEKAKPVVTVKATDLYLNRRGDDLLRKIFVHILRNSMDHGIERPSERFGKGKSEQGQISIQLQKIPGGVEVHFQDDGRGLHINRIRAIAEMHGIIKPDQKLTPEETAELIFCSGLSTAGKVNEVSGRGVGMDAVRSFLLNEDGNIKIHLLEPSHRDTEFYPFYFEIYLPDQLFAATGEDAVAVAA